MTITCLTAYDDQARVQRCQRAGRRCPKARINFHGLHVASIGREAFTSIADEPFFMHHQGPAGATQLTYCDVLEPVAACDKRRRIRFGAGLLEHVATVLKAKGFDVHCTKPIPRLWLDGPPTERGCEFLVRACRHRSLGVLPKLADRIRTVADLCTLQPEANILIVAKNNNEAKAIARRLKAVTSRIITHSHEIPNSHPWLYVSTSAGMRCCSTPFWHFIVFLDAELALSTTSFDHLMWSEGAAHIGFLTRDARQLMPIERAKLEGLFGPVIFAPGSGTPRTEVYVAWLQSTTIPEPANNTVGRKRTHLWTNDPRNRLIAHAAQAFRECSLAALKAVGLHDAAIWLGMPEKRPTVAVIVENLEHGEQLARLLPGWRLEAAGYNPPDGHFVCHDREITTLARVSESLNATSVVVYAAGGAEDWLKLATFAWAVNRRLIVDVEDRHDRLSTAETRSRQELYRCAFSATGRRGGSTSENAVEKGETKEMERVGA